MQKNTVVWASAGTGKTHKLVEVYTGLVESGLDPMRIAAMTFTEKAAAEMRERIRKALSVRDERWSKTIALLGAAPISTIHGFCGLLLRQHSVHLGIDPAFMILDEQHSLDLARESARDTIRQEIRAGNEDAEALFADFGLDNLVETLVAAGHWLSSLGVDEGWLRARVQDQAQAAAALEEELAEEIRRYGGSFEAIGNLADEVDARRAKHALRKRDDPAALLPKIGQVAGVITARRLSQLTGAYMQRFQARKSLLNAMDFDDLLLATRNLLKDHAAVRRHYQNHFQVLLIDEFQDTDEVQAEIVSLLAGDPDRPGQFMPAKLMIVGDPKQSIYRFRRARVTVFFRMLHKILDQGGIIEHLQDNYRSAMPITEFSNQLAHGMMDGAGRSAGEIANSDADLSYRIRFTEADVLRPRSEAPFLGITYVAAESDAKATHGRRMEAEAIARLLKQWKSSGVLTSWKEVAVLLRAMTNVEIYLNALEVHGIPVYVVQGTAFYQKSEVSDLIAFLELVLHPQDQLLRTVVLTSSLIGLTFESLLEGVGKSTSKFEELSGQSRNSSDFKYQLVLDQLLQPWLEKRDRATAAEILQDVIRKTNFDVVMMAQKNGPQRVANIGKLIEITRELARQGTTSLDDIVRFLHKRAHDTTVREPEAQIAGQGDDVVRVLSVHQAKGLEFDVVILPNLAARTPRTGGDRVFFTDRWGLLAGAAYGLHRKPLPHSLILRAKALEDDQQFEEEKRLLYVAVTRARKMLVLSEGFSSRGGPWLKWVTGVFENADPGAIEEARAGKPQQVKFKDFAVRILPASQLNLPEQLTLKAEPMIVGEPRIPLLPTPKFAVSIEVTPSELETLAGCFRYFYWTRLLGLAEPGKDPAGDTVQMHLGSIVHKIMERAVPPSASELAAAGLSDLVGIFKSSEWGELSNASPEREMPFMMHMNVSGRDCWIRGRMDAVVPGTQPRVVDYKYACWREGQEANYEIQMTTYSLALMKAIGADRATAELWYLKPPPKIVRREYAFDEANDRLRTLLMNYFEALEDNAWPPANRTYCDRVECGFRSECWQTRPLSMRGHLMPQAQK